LITKYFDEFIFTYDDGKYVHKFRSDSEYLQIVLLDNAHFRLITNRNAGKIINLNTMRTTNIYISKFMYKVLFWDDEKYILLRYLECIAIYSMGNGEIIFEKNYVTMVSSSFYNICSTKK